MFTFTSLRQTVRNWLLHITTNKPQWRNWSYNTNWREHCMHCDTYIYKNRKQNVTSTGRVKEKDQQSLNPTQKRNVNKAQTCTFFPNELCCRERFFFGCVSVLFRLQVNGSNEVSHKHLQKKNDMKFSTMMDSQKPKWNEKDRNTHDFA